MRSRRFHSVALPLILALLLSPALAIGHGTRCVNPDIQPGPPPISDRTDLMIEGFEDSWPPSGWDVIHLGSSFTWGRTDSEQHSGTYSAWMRYGPQGVPQDEYLVTEALDFSALSAAYLDFFEDQDYWPGYGEHHYIGVSTTSQTDPAAFTMIVDWTPANHDIAGFAGEHVTVNLSDYAGESVVYICFRYTGEYADNWYLDDVRVYEPFAHDVMVNEVLPDGEQFEAPYLLTPQAVLENHGANPETFDVQMVISESGSIVYDETIGVSLDIGEVNTFDFPTYELNSGQYYYLTATSLLAGDMDPSNDSASAFNNTYTEHRVPLGHFHTNSGCGDCNPADSVLDAYMSGQGNAVALMRIHTWWPNGADIIYLANIPQNQELINAYGADYTPHFWLDGTTDCEHIWSQYASRCEAAKLVKSPAQITLHWRPATEQVVARVEVINPLDPAGDYRLKVAFTEDNIYFAGGNGHNIHNQAFRYMYPDTDGLSVPAEVGTYTFEIDCPLSVLDNVYWDWVFEELRASAFVQDENAWTIWQAATGFLTELTGNLVITPPVTTVLEGAPFTLALDISPAELEVMGVEVQIDFDHTVVHLDSITPGTWLTGSGEEFYFYDYTPPLPEAATSIHFSTAFLTGAFTDMGQVAVCHFHALAEGAIPLVWSLTKVRDNLNMELDFATSVNDSIIVERDLTDAETAAPAALRLLGNQPNPFNPSTLIRYELPSAGQWRVDIFAVSGRRLRTLVDDWQEAGHYAQTWDGRNERGELLGSGLYFVRVSGPAGSRSGKMLLLK